MRLDTSPQQRPAKPPDAPESTDLGCGGAGCLIAIVIIGIIIILLVLG
ncbi:MAG: hypothetical protein OXC19_12540 [Bryobacterales bacterium]|nr:hypothetical protein [Bryobacterales bacterium]